MDIRKVLNQNLPAIDIGALGGGSSTDVLNM